MKELDVPQDADLRAEPEACTPLSIIREALDTLPQPQHGPNEHTGLIIEALSEAGFVIVPKEPTKAMGYAGLDAVTQLCSPFGIYKAMIAASTNGDDNGD